MRQEAYGTQRCRNGGDPRRGVIRSSKLFFSGFLLSTSTHSGLLPMTSTQGAAYYTVCVWHLEESIRSILSHRQRRGVLTGGSTAARSCRHVHEEGARPYRAQRRGVLTGGSTAARSCSYVRQESAHTCQGRALWDGVMTMPMSYSNYSTSWRRFTPRWLGPNIVK
jgi:hypothetical protein